LIYHGDKRLRKASKHRCIEGRLSRYDAIFDGSEENGNKVVITSLATPVKRHGPNALVGFRTSEQGFSKIDAGKIYFDLDDNWDYNLSNCFDIVIIDEAHVIKNPETASHLTVTWIKAPFTLLATASVLPNSIQDFAGYIRFIENDNTLWQHENLHALGVEKNVNPFLLPDDHPAVVLQV
jgi:SNF2 family DNA or RNA helicase